MSDNKYDTIIVGAGIAGLTSAAYLSREGRKVLLIEKNKECGGLVNTFTNNGFHFDAGVRALLDAGIILPMLKELDIKLEFVKSPVSLGIENKIIHIEGRESLKEYRELLVKLYPESEADIDNVMRIIRKIMKDMDVLYGVENPVFKDLRHNLSFIFKKLLPWLPKFLITAGKINRMNVPVEDYLKTIVKDPSLRDIITQHFFKNTPTFFALSYFSLYLDYIYPKGGVGKLSEALVNKISEYGGKIELETQIIEVHAGRRLVRDQKNRIYEYDNLIWAADLKTLYKIVTTKDLKPLIHQQFQETKGRMLNNRGGDSVFSLFLELDEPIESFRQIANGHFFYTPSKKGLDGIHRDELNDLLSNWEKVEKAEVLDWMDKFTRLNTYEISIPGLKDPDLTPDGKTGLIISLLAEYDLFRKVRESGWYDEFNSELESRIISVLTDSVYPVLKDKIIDRFSFTPVSIENRIGSSEGAITGWSFQNPVPVINRLLMADHSVLTPIPTIFQAGQWTYSPAGVPMSILTGRLAANKILKKG